MSTRFLKYRIGGVDVPQFQLYYIRDTKYPLHKIMVKFCHELRFMWWVNQELELQEWGDFIKSKKKQS